MVGRELTHMFPKEHAEIGEVVMSVRGLTRKGKIEDISFDIHRGEILGLAGLMGAGRTEVLEAIFGVARIDAGEISINGKRVQIREPADAIAHGLGMLTEDRKLTGIMGVLSVGDNMIDREPRAVQPARLAPEAAHERGGRRSSARRWRSRRRPSPS